MRKNVESREQELLEREVLGSALLALALHVPRGEELGDRAVEAAAGRAEGGGDLFHALAGVRLDVVEEGVDGVLHLLGRAAAAASAEGAAGAGARSARGARGAVAGLRGAAGTAAGGSAECLADGFERRLADEGFQLCRERADAGFDLCSGVGHS